MSGCPGIFFNLSKNDVANYRNYQEAVGFKFRYFCIRIMGAVIKTVYNNTIFIENAIHFFKKHSRTKICKTPHGERLV